MALQKAKFALDTYLKLASKSWNASILKALSVHSVEGDPLHKVIFKFTVQDDMCNRSGTMHGGALMTLVDDTTTIALLAGDPQTRGQVTSNLDTRFLSPAQPGDELTVIARNDKFGKSVGFCSCEIYKESVLVALASHTKIIFDVDIRELKYK